MADRVHIREVKPGDYVRFKNNPDRQFIVVGGDGTVLYAVDFVEVSNPPEWEVLLSADPMPTFRQLYK